MWTRTSAAVARATVVIAVLMSLVGCQEGGSVVSEKHAGGSATLNEQRSWAIGEIDAVIDVTGTQGMWRGTASTAPRWETLVENILDNSRKVRCAFEMGKPNPAALKVDLWSDPLNEDPFELAERVRELWTAAGWEVADIIRKGDTETERVYFRADRADGAEMSLEASDASMRKSLTLSVQAACSSDPSVAW